MLQFLVLLGAVVFRIVGPWYCWLLFCVIWCYICSCFAEFRWNATFMDYSARVAYDDSSSYG